MVQEHPVSLAPSGPTFPVAHLSSALSKESCWFPTKDYHYPLGKQQKSTESAKYSPIGAVASTVDPQGNGAQPAKRNHLFSQGRTCLVGARGQNQRTNRTDSKVP